MLLTDQNEIRVGHWIAKNLGLLAREEREAAKLVFLGREYDLEGVTFDVESVDVDLDVLVGGEMPQNEIVAISDGLSNALLLEGLALPCLELFVLNFPLDVVQAGVGERGVVVIFVVRENLEDAVLQLELGTEIGIQTLQDAVREELAVENSLNRKGFEAFEANGHKVPISDYFIGGIFLGKEIRNSLLFIVVQQEAILELEEVALIQN